MARFGKSTIGMRHTESRARWIERDDRAAHSSELAHQGEGLGYHGDALGELRRGLASVVLPPLLHRVLLENWIA